MSIKKLLAGHKLQNDLQLKEHVKRGTLQAFDGEGRYLGEWLPGQHQGKALAELELAFLDWLEWIDLKASAMKNGTFKQPTQVATSRVN